MTEIEKIKCKGLIEGCNLFHIAYILFHPVSALVGLNRLILVSFDMGWPFPGYEIEQFASMNWYEVTVAAVKYNNAKRKEGR